LSTAAAEERRFGEGLVEGWTPVSFAIAFVAKLRQNKRIHDVPSLRTTLSIPRFLTARYFRTKTLTARDYIEAAVYNTAPEDQAIAEAVARELLFPKSKEGVAATVAIAPTAAAAAPDSATATLGAPDDPAASILQDLAALDIDLDQLTDLSSLDALLDTKEEQTEEFQGFDLFERLLASPEGPMKSLGELIGLFGGPGELSAMGATDEEKARDLLRELLHAQVGSLSPQQAFHGCNAGFGDVLAREARSPWELAAALAGTGAPGLADHLRDLLAHGTARELGKTLQFLRPFGESFNDEIAHFRDAGLQRARDLMEYAELLEGLGEYVEPPRVLVERSARDNVRRSLAAAKWLEGTFSQPLQAPVFEAWAAGLKETPPLDFLLDVVTPCTRWEELTTNAYEAYCKELPSGADTAEQRGERALAARAMAERLLYTGSRLGAQLARELATEALCLLRDKGRFLPLLDSFLEVGVIPAEPKRLVKAGEALGISAEEIYERLEQPLEQLKYLILNNLLELARYLSLALKITEIPEDVMAALCAQCQSAQNLMGMATLVAVDLGMAARFAPADFVTQSIGYKGIGGGTNLLKQWFTHRDGLGSELRERIKAIAKNALLELSFDWITKGTGSAEQGLLPQTQARPFRGSDDLDLLDIESTLDAIIGAGKSLNHIGEEDLWVHDTAKGRAAFGVLIDISGSMSGRELTICAISVIMLLGRLRPEEIALAVFESDTHVIKSFAAPRELDEVADDVLDLRATGGTRVDAALRWIRDEFASAPEHEHRLLFLLSDFCFCEEQDELRPLAIDLADLGVRYLGAAHGTTCPGANELFLATIGGTSVKLPSVQKVPEVLHAAITGMGDAGVG
jgi:hypothetical protein